MSNPKGNFMRKGNNALAMLSRKIGICVLAGTLAFFIFTCATKSDAFSHIDHDVDRNHFEAAINSIKAAQKGKKPLYNDKNAVSLLLDLGFLEHYAGNYKASTEHLTEAERLIEEAFTKSITEGVTSFIANDNTKEYAGEDFEDIYINIFNALNYYKQGDLEGALVEVRKLTMSSGKLDMLSRKYEDARGSFGDGLMKIIGNLGITLNNALPQGDPVNFSNSALARYLSALFYLADKNEDAARIEFEQLQAAFASNKKVYSNPVPSDVAGAQNVPDGMARLNVLAFKGISPIKTEERFTQNWPFMKNSELQKPIFKLPVIVDRRASAGNIEVSVNGEKFQLELLEDMGAVTKETFNAKFANSFFKTFFRVLTKYVAADVAYQAAIQAGSPELAANIGVFATKKALDASEGADIRMGRFLPNRAYVGGINLEPGNYNVTVNFHSGTRRVFDVEVKAGDINLIDATCLK